MNPPYSPCEGFLPRSVTDLELGLQPSGSIDPPACMSPVPEFTGKTTHAKFFAWKVGNSNSGPHACIAGPLTS